MEGYRCTVCSHYHVGGPAPDVCPVCQAKNAFEPYTGPGDLTGTKTLENLKAAFAGESQANRRYTMYSRIADAEGAGSAVEAFDHAAAEETAHALGHLAYMGGYGTTADNLKTAIDGEGYETAEMYPQFAEIAEQEGFPEIAHYFRQVGHYENLHQKRYQKALEELGG